MVGLSFLIQIGALANAAVATLVLALVIALGYRRIAGADGNANASERPSESTEGPPLESWRHVYDVDKADADREITAVQEQASDLAEADNEARR
ncbi:hypothetical protein [Halococcus agarilyticus]|uniref:hypothetical protein n=1 Tax=Halococcus agarilyticus TaxID=1232219 RepID=UPI000677DDD0|nr:hypothetical protein [Halococcus agarilyticus]